MDSCKKSLFCFIHHFPFQFNAGFIFTFHNFIKTTYDISLDSQISLITKRILSTRQLSSSKCESWETGG